MQSLNDRSKIRHKRQLLGTWILTNGCGKDSWKEFWAALVFLVKLHLGNKSLWRGTTITSSAAIWTPFRRRRPADV